MKSKIESVLQNQTFMDINAKNIFVVDYSNQTNKIRGVEVSDIEYTDIQPFIISNSEQQRL